MTAGFLPAVGGPGGIGIDLERYQCTKAFVKILRENYFRTCSEAMTTDNRSPLRPFTAVPVQCTLCSMCLDFRSYRYLIACPSKIKTQEGEKAAKSFNILLVREK